MFRSFGSQTPNRLTKGGPRQYDAPRKWGTREIWGDEDERERREAINRLGEERSEGQQINDLRPAGRREDKEGRTDASNNRFCDMICHWYSSCSDHI
ncbi:hypothetical protein PRIPAC_97568 [Pristionchus pacificus]|uniref:Uncharacterized protein n=1 Tax=Pristionchus pacificus TaxID=54126 RepID=A0A2A6BCK7_PRIPA|nr:hypothetical protein PRIPAC_97568 [Pristionchus pacificus]|eukprot:PDM63608.1 hypothetical protein PRIPAC_49581 [Pristionchus pacificus]